MTVYVCLYVVYNAYMSASISADIRKWVSNSLKEQNVPPDSRVKYLYTSIMGIFRYFKNVQQKPNLEYPNA